MQFDKKLKTAIILLLAFIIFTVMVKTIDVQPAGPEDSEIGFAALNTEVFEKLGGYREGFETLTKLLGYLSLLVIGLFGCIGLLQLVKARSLKGVDRSIIILGVYYIVVLFFYVLFEKLVINYRPVIFDEGLEASYPSSHTVLVVAVMATLPPQLRNLLKTDSYTQYARIACVAVIAVMVIGRLLSGVHWFTDIIGGLLRSAALTMLYYAAMDFFGENERNSGGGKGKATGRSTSRRTSSGAGGAHLAR